MPVALSILRRIAEQQNFAALQEACLGAGTDVAAVRVLRALAEARLGNASAARAMVETLDVAVLDVDTRVDLAAVYLALGAVEKAAVTLEDARQADPDHSLLLARLAWCRLQCGDAGAAVALYQQSLSLKPRIAVYHQLVRLYRDCGRLADMATCLDAARRHWAVEQDSWPRSQRRLHASRLRQNHLELLLASGQFDAADAWIEDQRHVLEGDDWCDLVCHLAKQLTAHERHSDAEEALRLALRWYPDQPGLHVHFAELAQLQGRPRQAIAVLRRAIAIVGQRNQPADLLWSRVSTIALQWNVRLARLAAEQAHREFDALEGRELLADGELAPRCRQVELALAAVEAHEQNYAAAERRYRGVIEQGGELVPALQGLGQVYLQTGRIDEAAALFQRLQAVDPARGQGALISAGVFPEDAESLRGLERLVRTPSVEGTLRTALLFNLASAHEKRGDYDKAFALAEEANAASRRLLRYDPATHRQRLARIRHAFPRALFEHRRHLGHDSCLPVFVVGMPRSGTTLVEQILSGHSRIHGAGELGVIPRVIAGLERWERRTGSGRHYPDCVDDLDPRVIRGIAGSILEELREYACEADHVVDKLPHNFENIGLIKLIFPRAKIISVRRDPRDIAVSNYFTDYAAKHGGMGFAYDLDWIGEQLADHNLLMQHWQRVFPGEILEVRYEDIVENPQASSRRMLDYIGVDWQPQTLDFATLERPVRTASVWQVRKPLYASSRARWRRYRRHLRPLIEATNRKIVWNPIEMVTLPEAGWLNTGVDCYRQGDLDGAEARFKQLLYHLPEHAAARFMLGLVYVHKGHADDGIALMERALERCPWNRNWRDDLMRAYSLAGRARDAARLSGSSQPAVAGSGARDQSVESASGFDYLFLSGESPCPISGSESTRANC